MYTLSCKDFEFFEDAISWSKEESPSHVRKAIVGMLPDDINILSEEERLELLHDIDCVINEEPYTRIYFCSECNGSGEGRYEGVKCAACGGSGSPFLRQSKEDAQAEAAFDNDRF